jgi:hypothetical protein
MRLLARSGFLQAVWGTRMSWGRRAIQGSMGVAGEHGVGHMEGLSIGDAVIGALPQEKRHEVCKLLYLFQ